MNKLLDNKYYVIKRSEVKLAKNNTIYVEVVFRNVETDDTITIHFFQPRNNNVVYKGRD